MNKIRLISLLLLFSIVVLTAFPAGCASRQDVNLPIVLLTDFGSEDYRVPQLKGIIYSNNIQANVIDGTYDVPAFNIPTGAYILNMAAREFPENVVFIAIISPYDQVETKYLVLTTAKNQIFVLPDNGLLTYVIQEQDIESIYQITNQDLFDSPIAELSAERIQGKIGALMASGYRAEDTGTPLENYTTLDIQNPEIAGDTLLGTVVYIDHFGNAITNISAETATEFSLHASDTVNLKIGQQTVSAAYGTIYSDVAQGKEIIFVNNNLGVVQLSINLGDFATAYNIKAGAKLEITR